MGGKIDDERFVRMMNQCTAEQKALAEKIQALATYLEIPNTLPVPDITMKTRQGVSVSYEPAQHAAA